MSSIPLPIAGISVDGATIEAAGWTLLHFVWQGAIVAAALALFDTVLARSRPQLRYVAGCLALTAMIALPIATFVVVRQAHAPRSSAMLVSNPRVLSIASTSSGRTAELSRSITALPKSLARSTSRFRGLEIGRLREAFASSRLLPWFVGLWFAGVALLSLRLIGSWWLVTRISRSPSNVPIESCHEMWVRLVERMGVSRPVRLVRSSLVSVPTAIGWLRPVVLMPATTLTGLQPSQIEAILAHELAHIRRHDYVVNLLQSVVETLLFYHPAVWWVSKRIRDERELCCDDLAVRTLGDPILYARALCELEQLRGHDAQLALAANGGSLVDRIARLVGMGSRVRRFDASRGLAWALVASLVMIGGTAGGAVRVDSRAAATAIEASSRVIEAVARAASATVADRIVAEAVSSVTPAAVATATSTAIEFAVRTAAVVAAETAIAVAGEVACDEPQVEAEAAEATESESESESEEDTVADADPEYGAKSTRSFSSEEWERLANSGIGPTYVNALARAGYPDLSIDELISLAQHGVSSDYAAKLHRILGDLTVEEIVTLAKHGVSSAYVRAMHRELEDVGVEDLVKLANHGISSRYVAGMRELDVEDLSTDDLIRLASNGVTIEWFSSLRWMGYTDVSVERAIQLRNSGVTPEYAGSLRILNRNQLSLEELPALRNQGVEAEYAASMMGLLRKDLTVNQLIRLRQQGVSVEYVASLNSLGYSEIDPEELVTLRQQGVDPEFISAMAGAGYEGLDAADLVRLVQNGVTADFALQAREAGYEDLDVSELIRLMRKGIPASGTRK